VVDRRGHGGGRSAGPPGGAARSGGPDLKRARGRSRVRRHRPLAAAQAPPVPAPRSLPEAGAVPALEAAPAPGIEERALPIARELARVAGSSHPPEAKLEGALEIVFGAFGESGPDFAHLLLGGWARAAADGHYRLLMAWLREQFRLSIEEILDEGVRSGAFRADLDTGAVASVILGAAEGCLLQSGSQGGTVPTERLVRALVRLAVAADPGGASPGQRGFSSIR
jgi:hypothetical protein